jgi:hypothetical protein
LIFMAPTWQQDRAALPGQDPEDWNGTAVADAFEPRIRELLAAFPSMLATVIGQRIGWPYSARTLSGRVAE